jgi:hypothetical protein
MDIYSLMTFSIMCLLVFFIWQHNNISLFARAAAKRHCDKEEIQLLDQNVILKRITICRSSNTLFALRRKYIFEFSSVGDHRYKGVIFMRGHYVENIELEPFKTISF